MAVPGKQGVAFRDPHSCIKGFWVGDLVLGLSDVAVGV